MGLECKHVGMKSAGVRLTEAVRSGHDPACSLWMFVGRVSVS